MSSVVFPPKSWKSGDGKLRAFDKMTTDHIINTMLYIKGRLQIESDPETVKYYKASIIEMLSVLKTRKFSA
jgi:hypothetical protein